MQKPLLPGETETTIHHPPSTIYHQPSHGIKPSLARLPPSKRPGFAPRVARCPSTGIQTAATAAASAPTPWGHSHSGQTAMPPLAARHISRSLSRLSPSRFAFPRPRLGPRVRAIGMASTANGSPESTSSATTEQPRQAQQPEEQQTTPNVAPHKVLPAPGAGETATALDVSGDGTTVKLDALGPLVVNQDGTMSRISNWAAMADIERQNALRILGKRNKLRLNALRQSQKEADDSSART